MSRVLGNTRGQAESGEFGLDPVKLPHVPMSGTMIVAFLAANGDDTNFSFVVQQGPTSSGPWTPAGPVVVMNDPGEFVPIIGWIRFSATEKWVRLLSTVDTEDLQRIGVLCLDDPLVHWEPCP